MATKIPAPKVRKAKSSSAEAFRKFLSKRVDIVEEDDETDPTPTPKPEKVKKPEKPEKAEKVGGPNPADLQRMYSDLLSELQKMQNNQEILYQQQARLKNKVKSQPIHADTPRPTRSSSPDLQQARRQALLRF
jgi:hypothetical protein